MVVESATSSFLGASKEDSLAGLRLRMLVVGACRPSSVVIRVRILYACFKRLCRLGVLSTLDG